MAVENAPPANTPEPAIVDVMGRKALWFGISAAMMIPGIIAIILCYSRFGAPVKLGIDFTGGSLLQMRFDRPVTVEQLRGALATVQLDGHKVEGEIQEVLETARREASGSVGGTTLILRTRTLAPAEVGQIKADLAKNAELGSFVPERVETVGPKIGAELLRNAMLALGAGILVILGYIAVRYQFDFAMCAIAAMVHDVIVMIGSFAILSLTLGAEADGLLVTALLTVMGFSVHDTIVIFDRFRENLGQARKGDTFGDVANRSVNQTFARSVNTSLTVVLTLIPLVLFGGSSIFFFCLAMLIGIVSGTYSSIFNAAPLLVLWRDRAASRTTPPEGGLSSVAAGA